MKKIIVFLIFASFTFFVSGEKLAEFDNVYKPRNFQVAGDDLYIVDGSVIKLFSMKDFKLIIQFGKKGEGPGEFKFYPQIMVFPEQIVVTSMGKVSFFNRRGIFVEEKKTEGNRRMFKVKGHYLGNKSNFDRKNFSLESKINIYNGDFGKIREIYSYVSKDTIITGPGIKKKQDLKMIIDYTRAVTNGEHVFVGDTRKGFHIEIYNHRGIKVKTISKDFPKLKVSEEYKKREMDRVRNAKNWERFGKNFNHIFPEYFPAFRRIIPGKQKIYIITHKPLEGKQEVIILDMKGNILKTTQIPKEKYFNILNDKFYYFVDNEDDEVMEFHSIDL